eukprot:6369178-Amphidinium_carterae.1
MGGDSLGAAWHETACTSLVTWNIPAAFCCICVSNAANIDIDASSDSDRTCAILGSAMPGGGRPSDVAGAAWRGGSGEPASR